MNFEGSCIFQLFLFENRLIIHWDATEIKSVRLLLFNFQLKSSTVRANEVSVELIVN